MTKSVSLKTFVLFSFVATFISACGLQPVNTNQAELTTNKSYGFSTLAETRTEAQIRENYLKAHASPKPTPTATPIVKKSEPPKPTKTPEAPKPTPVKTAEPIRQLTPEEIKIREDYLKAHSTPVPQKTEAPKPVPTPLRTPESPKPTPTPVKSVEAPKPVPTPVKTAEVPRQLTPEEIKVREDYLKAHSTPVPQKTETPKATVSLGLKAGVSK